MAEPTLSDISNINSEPERSGIAPVPVIDNSRMVETLNHNARFSAEQTWRKYTKFLENKNELFKNIGEIQGLDVATEDREALHKQAGDIFADILKDPTVAMGGIGYDQLQGKIAKFKSDAMASKQDKLDYETNKLFMDRNPDLYTDENVATLENNRNAPLGTRKSVMLKMPTIFDEKSTFATIKEAATQPYTAIVGKDGKPGSGYIESGNEVNPNAISELWKLALNGQKDKYGHSILNAVTKNFKDLSPEQQKRYGSVENYFADKGQQYLGAYFPEGSYEKTPEGNLRFGKKLTADPNYLGAERLSLEQQRINEEIKNNKVLRSQGWARIGLEERRLNNVAAEDSTGALSVINEAASILNNGTKLDIIDRDSKNKRSIIRISDPTLLQKFGNVDKDNKVTNVPDAINFDPQTNQPTLIYYSQKDKIGYVDPITKKAIPPKTENFKYEREIPLDQRTWLKLITQRSFPNKDIGEINNLVEKALMQNNNSIFDIAQKLKKQNQQQAAPAQTPAATQQYQIKGKPYTKADLINGGWTEAQFNEAVKSGKLK